MVEKLDIAAVGLNLKELPLLPLPSDWLVTALPQVPVFSLVGR